jgi:hypothetical protein
MNFQTAAKAVKLKNLIDNAHKYLPKIGRCLSLEVEFKREHIDPEEETYGLDLGNRKEEKRKPENKSTNSNKKARTLEEIHDKLARVYDLQSFRMKGSGFKDFAIKVLGEEIQLRDISLENIKKWCALGSNSGFGNVMKQETQHNAQVRSSRELDASQFTVSEQNPR